jgi:hypothetical protein
VRATTAATNVAGVLDQLDALIADARSEGSRLGLFAALYRRVTRRVATGIASGFFDDGARMDRLDTNFANRYFAALNVQLAGRATPKAWGVAFDAANDPAAIALQHLLLGINAHINVDLGAAVAEVSPGDAVRRDFERIGDILADMTDTVEAELDAVSPRIADLDAVAGKADERLAVFSIRGARDDAWVLATSLAITPPPLRSFVKRIVDDKAAFLGRVVAHPPPPAGKIVASVREVEERDVRRVIDVLAG